MFREVPEPSDKGKDRELRPETHLDPMCYVPKSSDEPVPREVIDKAVAERKT